MAEAISFAGGIWVFWKRNKVDIDVLAKIDQIVTLAIKKGSSVDWVLSAVYASPVARYRNELWCYISNLGIPKSVFQSLTFVVN